MKHLQIISIFLVVILFSSCKKEENVTKEGSFKFISEYSATITVGGFVGIEHRTFAVGEVYEGIDEGGETVKIRIAEHSQLNDDCPNSWCYQEFLEVPREHLQYVK